MPVPCVTRRVVLARHVYSRGDVAAAAAVERGLTCAGAGSGPANIGVGINIDLDVNIAICLGGPGRL